MEERVLSREMRGNPSVSPTGSQPLRKSFLILYLILFPSSHRYYLLCTPLPIRSFNSSHVTFSQMRKKARWQQQSGLRWHRQYGFWFLYAVLCSHVQVWSTNASANQSCGGSYITLTVRLTGMTFHERPDTLPSAEGLSSPEEYDTNDGGPGNGGGKENRATS